MAALNGVSVQALRLYDRLGLLKPERVDELTGYRYYDIRQSARLDAIQYLKALGMPLREIGELLEREDPRRYEVLLEAQALLVERRKAELDRMGRAIARARDAYRRYAEAPREGLVVLERLPARRAFVYDGGQDIYQGGLPGYEALLRRLKAVASLRGLPAAYFCNVGSIVRRAELEAGRMRSTEAFVFVEEDFEAADGPGALESLPAGTYACAYFEGFDKELAEAERLLAYVAASGFGLAGDYVCEVVAELPLFPREERAMLIKIQVPVALPR